MKKIISLLSAIIAFAVAAFIISYYFKEKKLEPIRTSGIVQGTEINITSKIPGKISEICYREGDTVEEGSVVIRLENDDLKAAVEQAKASVEKVEAEIRTAQSAIENSKANLSSAEADIRYAEAEIKKARVQMEEAKRQTDRANALYKEDFIPRADLDQVATNYEAATANHEALKARLIASISRKDAALSQVDRYVSELSSAKARLKETKAILSFQEVRFNDTIITTPISGTVVYQAMETGEFVSPGAAILTIVDMDNLWVRVDLEETIVGHVSLESEVFVTVDALPEKVIKGKISEIGRYAEFATQRDVKHGRQDIKTFHVKIKFEEPERILKPGMTVNVEIPEQVKSME